MVDSAPGPFCLNEALFGYMGWPRATLIRSLNEDTAQEQLYVDAYMFLVDLMPSSQGSRNLLCSEAERWIQFFQKNSMRPACPLFLAESQF